MLFRSNGGFLGPGGIAPDQKALYGSTRVSGILGAAWHTRACNRLEGKAVIKYINGRLADGVPSLTETIEGTCLVTKNGWGVMTRFYHGQDYYNLGFTTSVTRFQLGLTYSQEGFMKFRLRE